MTRASCPEPFNRQLRQPGSTPDPVTATAAWDPAVSQARVTFTASTTATVDHYELRHCPGAECSTDDEITIATTPAAGPLLFLILAGLATPGSTALYRVYVITATGNESGSNTVSANRPAWHPRHPAISARSTAPDLFPIRSIHSSEQTTQPTYSH